MPRLVTPVFLLFLSCWLPGIGWGAQTAEDQALARRLLASQGCKACHKFEGGGTTVGPSLEEICRDLNRTELYQQLVNPEKGHGNGLIPDFSHLRANELEALVSFLHELLPEGQRTTPNLRSNQNSPEPGTGISKP